MVLNRLPFVDTAAGGVTADSSAVRVADVLVIKVKAVVIARPAAAKRSLSFSVRLLALMPPAYVANGLLVRILAVFQFSADAISEPVDERLAAAPSRLTSEGLLLAEVELVGPTDRSFATRLGLAPRRTSRTRTRPTNEVAGVAEVPAKPAAGIAVRATIYEDGVGVGN